MAFDLFLSKCPPVASYATRKHERKQNFFFFVFCQNLPAQNKTMGTSQFYFNASLVVITAELTTFTVTATAALQK